MSKKFKVYTKTGDDGNTGLVGGNRVKKYDLRLEAYGTVDELNASIGVLRSNEMPDYICKLLIDIQNKLFNIGSRLASDEKGEAYTENLIVTENHVEVLEKAIDEFEVNLPVLADFVLPGGEISAAYCHVSRTICRRAERRILEFSEQYPVPPTTIKYINRLSDFLFVLSRKLAYDKNVVEEKWKKD